MTVEEGHVAKNQDAILMSLLSFWHYHVAGMSSPVPPGLNSSLPCHTQVAFSGSEEHQFPVVSQNVVQLGLLSDPGCLLTSPSRGTHKLILVHTYEPRYVILFDFTSVFSCPCPRAAIYPPPLSSPFALA